MRLYTRAILTFGAFCFLVPSSFAAGYGPYAVASAIAVDGDTIKGDVLVWPGLTANTLVRVRGVDAPELRGALPCERAAAALARDFATAWLVANHPISISDVAPDKFGGRVDAHVRGANGGLLASALLAAGHARPYTGGTREPWCN